MNQEWDNYQKLGLQAESMQNMPYAEAMWAMAVLISQQFGNSDPRVAVSLDSLGRIMVRQNKFKLAENILGRSWAIKTQISKVGNEELTKTLDLVGEMYFRQGRLDEARGICQRVLEMYQTIYAADHPMMQVAYNNLAMVDSARLQALSVPSPPQAPQPLQQAQSVQPPQSVQQAVRQERIQAPDLNVGVSTGVVNNAVPGPNPNLSPNATHVLNASSLTGGGQGQISGVASNPGVGTSTGTENRSTSLSGSLAGGMRGALGAQTGSSASLATLGTTSTGQVKTVSPQAAAARGRRVAGPVCESCGNPMDGEWCYRCTGNSVKAIAPDDKLGR
jgi:hypothetical protein